MHRHGYQGRKFGRETDQREALIKSLAESLIIHESVETTLPKAKELRRYLEKLITKAKKGDLHSRRQVINGLQTLKAAHKLVDDVAPKLAGRTSGHLRIKRGALRRGDGAQLATISFVDDLKAEVKPAKPAAKKAEVKPKATAKAPAAKKAPARKTGVKK
ncbi:50S ribosomal protein L17 [Candidatus Saccharibacteria bacterium]|jgi:large subunit ribosomal protein L17|nr:50S ribosomal protein L17 [Candidatus Saccharibacteria bacterium]